MEFGKVEYMVVAFVIGAVLVGIIAASMKNQFRVEGVASWLALALFAPVPVLLGKPLAGLVALPTEAALPSVGVTVVLAVLWIHLILPALLPDFQVNALSASCVPAVCLGLAVLVSGMALGEFPQGIGVGQQQAIFEGRSAGLDLGGTGIPE